MFDSNGWCVEYTGGWKANQRHGAGLRKDAQGVQYQEKWDSGALLASTSSDASGCSSDGDCYKNGSCLASGLATEYMFKMARGLLHSTIHHVQDSVRMAREVWSIVKHLALTRDVKGMAKRKKKFSHDPAVAVSGQRGERPAASHDKSKQKKDGVSQQRESKIEL
jgi:hypothetical protein